MHTDTKNSNNSMDRKTVLIINTKMDLYRKFFTDITERGRKMTKRLCHSYETYKRQPILSGSSFGRMELEFIIPYFTSKLNGQP